MKLERILDNENVHFNQNEKSEVFAKDFRFCDLSAIEDHSVVLIKDKKNLKLVEEVLLEKKELCLVLSKDLFDSEEVKEQFKNHTLSYVENFDQGLCHISKLAFEEKNNDCHDSVDGRKLGTTDIHPSADIAENVFIGSNVKIEEGVKIYSGVKILSNSSIGKNSVLYSGATVYPYVKIGNGCRVHSNAVIGADGFGFRFIGGKHHKVYHSGGVLIGDDVEVGAATTIDAGTFSPTIIGTNSKFDNQVQIGHNCKIGQGVIFCAQTAVGGSSVIGDFTVFGGKSGMTDHATLGKACQVAGGALVNCSWPDGTVLGGHPARPLKEWMRGLAYLRKQTKK
ncbi:MAG: UDP-3-O-(3-hydroxymyristoyl)glucosamine N-acyltransferase [Bacteriovoracaceae bacterium]